MYGVHIGMPDLDVNVFCTDDGSCITIETFVNAVIWISKAKKILAMYVCMLNKSKVVLVFSCVELKHFAAKCEFGNLW